MGKAGLRRLAGLGVLLALAACAPNSSAVRPPAAPTALVAPPPAPLAIEDSPTPTWQPRAAPDQCGAGPLQSLVGRPKEEIPIPLEPGRRRVVCTSCPMTQDYSAERQTIQFDAATGRVTSVACD